MAFLDASPDNILKGAPPVAAPAQVQPPQAAPSLATAQPAATATAAPKPNQQVTDDLMRTLNQLSDPSTIKTLMDRKAQIDQQQIGNIQAGIKKQGALVTKMREAYKKSPELMLKDLTPAPPDQLQSGLKVFGTVAPWLGIFASMLTRAPLTSAMNSAAAAIKGYQEGNKQALDHNFRKWEADTRTAIKQNDMEIERYNAAREKYGDNINELKTEYELIASETKNENMLAAIRGGQIDLALDLPVKYATASAKLSEALIKVTGGNTDTLTPEAKDIAAASYLATGKLPYLGMGPNANRIPILNRAGEIAKAQGLNTQDVLSGRVAYKADQASLSSLQKQSDAATAYMGTMEKNITIVNELMNKGSGTSAGPVVNRWLQAGRKATGDPDVAAFNAAITTVMNEYAKILSGSFGNTPATDASRRETEGMLSKFDSPQAIIETFNKTIIPDSQNRIRSYQEQISAIRSRVAGGGGSGSGGGQATPPPPSSPTMQQILKYDEQGNLVQ